VLCRDGKRQYETNEEVGAVGKFLDFTRASKMFVRESWAELKKVTWPTKQQVKLSTMWVIGLTVAVGIYLFFVDFALSALLTRFLG
jgi:preprotein translocase subunit SecE